MPRNAAGVYSLPDPPRVPNTTIDSPDENITRDDIGAELTNSLDRNGRGGMLAPFRIADGTMAAPGLGFLNDPDNGLYRIGADDWALAVGGQKSIELTAGQITLAQNASLAANLTLSLSGAGGQVLLSPSANPALAFNGFATTGMLLAAPSVIGFKTNNVTQFEIGSSAGPNFITIIGGADPTIAVSGGSLILPANIGSVSNITFNPAGAGQISMGTADGADNQMLILSGGGGGTSTRGAFITLAGNENGALGAVARIASGNSGTANDAIDLFVRGERQVIINAGGAGGWITLAGGVAPTIGTNGANITIERSLTMLGDRLILLSGANGQVLGSSTASPAFAFNGSATTGMRLSAPSVIGFMTNGTEQMRIGSSVGPNFLTITGGALATITVNAANLNIVPLTEFTAGLILKGSAAFGGASGFVSTGGGGHISMIVNGVVRMKAFIGGTIIMNGSEAALANAATEGFTYLPTMPGTPTGVPTAFGGNTPVVLDNAANRLWCFIGGAWRFLTFP